MAMYVSLLQFTEQGIHDVKDTVKRSEAADGRSRQNGHDDCPATLDDGRLRRGSVA